MSTGFTPLTYVTSHMARLDQSKSFKIQRPLSHTNLALLKDDPFGLPFSIELGYPAREEKIQTILPLNFFHDEKMCKFMSFRFVNSLWQKLSTRLVKNAICGPIRSVSGAQLGI